MEVTIEGKGIPTMEVEIKDVTLDERKIITRNIFKMTSEPESIFDCACAIIKAGTNWNDAEINKYNDDTIYAIAREIYTTCSKKK